jgi:hypothetical protein
MAVNEIVKKLPSNAIWKHFKGDGETMHFYCSQSYGAEYTAAIWGNRPEIDENQM